MSYKVVGNPSVSWWERGNLIAKHLLLGTVTRRQVGMLFVYSLLLLAIIYTSIKSSSPFVPIVIVVGVVIAVWAILRPSFALLLAFTGAGLPSLVIQLSFHSMRPVELGVALCVLIVVLYRPYLRLRLPHLLALLFLGIGIVSFIHVPDFSTNLNAYAADKELYSIALFIIALFCGTFLVGYIKNMSSFLVTVLLCNSPLYLICLAQALGIHVISYLEDSGAQDPLQAGGRLWGPFTGAVTFGSYLVNLLAVAVACWLLGTRRSHLIIGAIMTVATALTIVGSGTRSVAAAAVVMVVIALLVTRRFKLLLATIVSSGIVILIFLGKILPKFTHTDVSASNRLFLWQEALKLIQAHPWLGIGLEQFHNYYLQLIVSRSTQLNPDGISVHNQYLAWALSSGIIWTIIAVALLISIIYYCAKAYRNAQREHRTILLAAILAVLANIIVCFVDVPLEKTEGAVFLFLLAGFALGYVERVRWGVTRTPTTTFATPALSVQAVSPTGIDRGLYKPSKPIPVQLGEHVAAPSPTLQSAGDEADSQDEAPSAQKTGRSVILQLLSWGTSAVIIFPATALLTRYLGPVRYGEYSFTIPFLSIFALLSGTGMDPLITRLLSRQKRSTWGETLSYAAGTRLLTTLVVSGGAALTALLLPVSTEQRVLLLLGSGCLLFSYSFNGLRTVYECGYWAEQRIAVPSLIEAIDRVVTSGLIVVALIFHLSLPWTYILIVYSDLPFSLALAILAGRRFHMRIRFSLAHIREYLFGSLSLTIHNALSLFISQANLLLLLPLAGSLNVGLYALALRITSPLLSIATAYVIGLYPLLCKKFEEGREQFSATYNETLRIMILAVIPLTILIILETNKIVLLLGGTKFIAASRVTQVLMGAVLATFLSQLAVRSCMAADKEHFIPYVTGTSLVVNVLANFILVPHWQATGAAMAALLSQCTAFVLFTVMLARHIRILQTLSIMLRVVLGNLPALLFLLWQQNASLLLLIPTFLLLVIVGCIVTRTLSLKDVLMVRHILFTRTGKMSSKKIDITEQPTIFVPSIYDIADQETLSLPRIQL